ncbi:MAG: 4-hydroxy-tetrahydrodipicolinate reductase [Deltaproteobacteria bacterium]|nr:4-hydroxy-tetrahydrodipicolinate reductase [Deltaproteobacteria bacterium]
MGRAVARLAAETPDVQIVGAVEAPGSPALGRDLGELAAGEAMGVAIGADPASALLGAEALIDFSLPPAVPAMLRAAMHAGVAVVSGTTGLDEDCERLLVRASAEIPVLWAPNLSLGVQLLAGLVEQAMRALGAGYDVEIVETHHRAKIDAPSGTAKQLVEAARRARPELGTVHGREGRLGPRPVAQLGVHAVRGGAVVGDHTVHLIGLADRIELSHRAMSRDVFAQGALRAARFLAGKPPGRYALGQVLSTGREEPHGC